METMALMMVMETMMLIIVSMVTMRLAMSWSSGRVRSKRLIPHVRDEEEETPAFKQLVKHMQSWVSTEASKCIHSEGGCGVNGEIRCE